MSETLHGHVTALTRQGDGDELAADAAVNAVLLVVNDVADFDEAGGRLRLNTVVYDYTGIDDDVSTITLASPGLTAAAVADDPVEVWDPEAGSTVVEFIATVVDDTTDDVIQAVVAHDLADRMADNIRGLIGESVVCEEDGDGIWVLTRVLGRSPAIAGDFVVVGDKPLLRTLDEIYADADATAAAAADAAFKADAAQGTADGKNTVTYSNNAPGTAANKAGDIWFQRDGTPNGGIIAQYEGQGGTSWASRLLRSEVIANLDAGKITAGTAFINALQVLTNFTLGDANTNGVIQSFDFANQPVGVLIDKNGLVAKGGTVAGAQVTGSYFSTANTRMVMSDDALRYYGTDGVETVMIRADGFISSVNHIVCGNSLHGYDLYADNEGPKLGGVEADAVLTSQGRVAKKGSTRKIKKFIKPLTLKQAAAVLDIEAVSFQRKVDPQHPGEATDTRFPGFIAEQAAEVGAELWVTRDSNGEPAGIRYPEIAVAHNVVLRDALDRITQLEDTVADLASRLTALEGAR